MELKFRLTKEEYIHKTLHLTNKVAANRNRRFVMAVYLALCFGALTWITLSSLPMAVIGAALGSLIGVMMMRAGLKSRLAQTYRLLHVDEDVTVELTEGGLYAALPHIRSQVDWEAFTEIEEDEVGFYLNYGPYQAIFVPRRAFASAAEAQRFWAQAQESWQFARPTPAATNPVRV